MDCIEDNVTTTLILPNLWCHPTTLHVTHYGLLELVEPRI